MSSIRQQDGVIFLSGELDHASVGALREQATHLLREEPATAMALDCSGVTRANSAGLALLLAILRDAAELDKSISIGQLPADMQQMARVCELAAVLQSES